MSASRRRRITRWCRRSANGLHHRRASEFAPAAVDPENPVLTPEIVPDLFRFPADMGRVPAEVNSPQQPGAGPLFEQEWRKVVR